MSVRSRRVAIIGCGRAAGGSVDGSGNGLSHIEAIAANGGLEAVAAFDTDAAALGHFCQRWNLAATNDWDALLSHSPDCLLIASPTPTHANYLALALDAGIGLVTCEKPLSEDAATASRITDDFRQQGASLLVYYPRRWTGDLSRAANEIASGTLGEPETFHAFYGGGIRNIGCHLIDLVQRLLGPVAGVAPVAGRVTGAGEDPTLDLALWLDSGLHGIFQGYDYGNYALFELDILCTHGRLRIKDLGFGLEIWRRTDSEHYPGYAVLSLDRDIKTDYGDAAHNFWSHCAKVMADGNQVVDDGDCAILHVVDCAMTAAKEGRRVEVRAGD